MLTISFVPAGTVQVTQAGNLDTLLNILCPVHNAKQYALCTINVNFTG